MMLSVIIPSRREMFLSRTIEDILEHSEADTEVIAVLDGAWADPSIKQHERVNVIYVPESVGQRVAQDLAVKLARGKYIMKSDAHCSFDQGFDRKMLEGFQIHGDNVTAVPIMRNLHSFDWKCRKCKWIKYQGPTPKRCEKCNDSRYIIRKMRWKPRHGTRSVSYCFNSIPHFDYNNAFKDTEHYKNGVLVGYELTLNEPCLSLGVIQLLANFANSHHFPSGIYSFWGGKDVAFNAMRFSAVEDRGSIGATEILGVGDQLQVGGVATSSIFAEMVKNGDILTSTARQGSNQPRIGDTVGKCFFAEVSTPTITATVSAANPIPTAGSTINSDIIQELNSILGGQFIYNEKTSSFHNGSVELKPIYSKFFTETMSLQGSCFMATKEKYIELDLGGDMGSWGNQGLQVACATWLSGGRVLVNHNTWYAHMFRTQGLDFGFPYQMSGNEVQRTKNRTRDLFWQGKHPKQIYPVSWLVRKFFPVKGWREEDIKELEKEESEKK